MKLHDLTVGDRFTFSDKHRGKVFEVTLHEGHTIIYKDIATHEGRITRSNRKTFRMSVQIVTTNRVVELTPHEVDTLKSVLHSYYLNEIDEAMRAKINALHIKLTESAGRRVVRPEGE